ncbi:MAG: glycosyltransferase family 2 protein [Vulcanimicrobiaceae bacterium]
MTSLVLRSCVRNGCAKSANSRQALLRAINPHDVTAVILTRDEERTLPRALRSLPHGMPVLILDANSSDGTREVAELRGASVLQRAWTDFVDARRFALAQVRTPWTLMLDADEALDAELRDAVVKAPADADGYMFERTTFFCGKPIRMWRREELLRLFRPEHVRLEARPASSGGAALHERWISSGRVRTLRGTLLHYSYPDVSSYRRKYERYTSIEAAGLQASPGMVAAELVRAVARFLWLMLVRGEALDGWRGAYVAWSSAFYPVAVAWKGLRR